MTTTWWGVLGVLGAAVLLAACAGDAADDDLDDELEAQADAGVDATAAAPCDVSAIPRYVPVAVDSVAILPSATAQGDEVIDDQVPVTKHVVTAPADARPLRPELLVWLPGSGSEPPQFKVIQNVAAFAGYRSVSLGYLNEISVEELCHRAVDDDACDETKNPNCEEEVREEIVYGDSVSDTKCVQVSRTDSVEHRLLRLVQFLHAKAPTAGFDEYFEGDALRWDRLVVAGWSQGGGHAGILSRDHLVARALFVSKGAGAYSTDGTSLSLVPWAYQPRATPPSREFGAVHELEGAALFSPQVFETWGLTAVGQAPNVNVDAITTYPDGYAQYQCSHVISTRAPAACDPSTSYHKSMAIDACLAPGPHGVPLLAHAYLYALTVPIAPPPPAP